MSDASQEEKVKAPRHRSPNYPALDLETAIARARTLHSEYGTHAIAYPLFCKKLGYKEESSAAGQCVAALKSFGLADVTGVGSGRKVAVSKSADRILKGAPDRARLLEEAALLPAIHKEVWTRYRETGLPHDDVLRQYLVWDRAEGQSFNPETVDTFISRFRSTLRFAGITAGGTIDEGEEGEEEFSEPLSPRRPQVGDYVQWTSQGVDQFKEPKQLIGFSPDGGYADVGESSWVPVSELSVVDPPVGKMTPPAFPPPSAANAQSRFEEKPAPPGSFRHTSEVDEGPIALEIPLKMSEVSVLELEAWLDSLLFKIRRRAGMEPKK